eukprot:scaffold9308_cov115-Cylindrotheca_fusiformis.AAC.7
MAPVPPLAPSPLPQPSKEEAEMTESLAQDRPTIDAATKSFISLICARSLTASATDEASSIPQTSENPNGNTLLGLLPANDGSSGQQNDGTSSSRSSTPTVQQQVLQVARSILQATNAYTFPVHCTVATSMGEKPGTSAEKKKEFLELSTTAQLWNGLVQSNQKPSRFLGRRALRHAWKNNLRADINSKLQETAAQNNKTDAEAEEAIVQRQTLWLLDFERFLFHVPDPNSSPTVDDDAALVWDADGGKQELAKRRDRRQAEATKRGPVTPS